MPDASYESMDSPLMTSKELKKLKKLLRAFDCGYRMSLLERNNLNATIKFLNQTINGQLSTDKAIIKKRIKAKINSIRYTIYEFFGGDF